MSWLYTIVFAGLMFSSDAPPADNIYPNRQISGTVAVAAADETERFEQTYPLAANGRVSVSNVNGSITVETWDRNEVKLEYVKTADAKENLGEVEIRIDARQQAFNVETEYLDWKRPGASGRTYSKLQVEYRLTVPRGAALSEIETVNGSVRISNAGNLTKASAVNGEVRAQNLSGTADLSTVNGTVVADFDRLPANGRISLNTVNGTVDLLIPSDADATVRADTVNGNITNDFNLPVRKGQYVGRDLHGRIGAGAAQIRLNSVNGALSIKRKNDGKTLSPATDLSGTKNAADAEDRDADDENGSGALAKPPKPPKPPKAPKPPGIEGIDGEAISKELAESMKLASKELAKIKPELEKQYAEAMKQAAAINSEEMQRRYREAARYGADFGRAWGNYWTLGAPVVEKKSGSFAVKNLAKITVEAKDCSVAVRGWDKPEVAYKAVRVTRAPAKSVDVNSTVSATKTGDSNVDFVVAAETRDNAGAPFDEATRMHLEIFVPRRADLKIRTGGEIRLEGVSGALDLEGGSEAINVRDAGGKLNVSATDARVRVIGFSGAFDGKTANGAMNLEGDFERLAARTVNGTIVLTLPDAANATIESNRKDIAGEGLTLAFEGDGQKTSRWKIGKGGANHLLYATADGKIFVRAASRLQGN